MTRTQIMLLVLASVALLTIGGVWIVLTGETFREYIRQQLVARLESATGGKVSVRALHLQYFPPRVLISDLRIVKESSAAPAFLTIRAAEAYPHLASLFGVPSLRRLIIHEPQLRIEVARDGSTNLPRPKTSSGQNLFQLVVEKLDVEKGIAQYNLRQESFETQLEGVVLSARYLPFEGRYQGTFSHEKGQLRFGQNLWTYGLELSVSLHHNQLDVERLLFATPAQSRIEAKGVIKNFPGPSGEFTYHGDISLAEVRSLHRELRDLQGTAQLAGTMTFSGDTWKTTGNLNTAGLSMKGVKVQRFASQFELSPQRLQLTRIQMAGLHGNAEGELIVESPLAERRYKADFRVGKIGLLDLSLLAGLEKVRFAGELSGTLQATWLDQGRKLAGQAHLRISEAPQEVAAHGLGGQFLPIHGELNIDLSQRSSRFDRSFLQFGQTKLQFVGTVSVQAESNLRIEATSEDLSDPAFLAPELKGKGSLLGVLEGTQSQPTARGSFVADNLSYQRYQVDHAQGQFAADRSTIDLSNVDFVHKKSRIRAGGKIFLDPDKLTPTGDIHLLASLKEVRAEDLLAAAGYDYSVSGNVSGDFMATGRYPRLELQGIADVSSGKVFDQTFDRGRFEIHYNEPVLELGRFDVEVGKGKVAGSATVDLAGETIKSKISGTAIPLDQLQWLRSSNNPISGSIRKFDIKAEGPYRRPALEGQIDVAELTVAGERLGDFQTRLQTENEILRFQTSSLTPEVDLNAAGTIDLSENLNCIAQLNFKNFVLTPYVKKVLPVAPEKLSSRAQGQLVLSGPLRHPEKLLVTGRLQSIEIDFREARLQAAKPFEIEVRDERVNIKKAVFTGKGTVLNIDGLVDISAQKQLQLSLQGELDLALLNEFVSKLSAGGSGTLNASVRGTLSDPHVQGQARVTNGQFAYADFPNSFTQANGSFFFDENQIRIENFNAVSGGGKVEVGGDVVFGGEQIRLMNLRIQGREVRIRYPEGMRNVVDADLTLRGSPQAQVLAGNVRIVSASFQKGYDPITQYFDTRTRQVSWPAAQELGSGLSLDLTITGDRNIKLDTQLVKMTSRADLRVKGTATNPLVTGSIEAS